MVSHNRTPGTQPSVSESRILTDGWPVEKQLGELIGEKSLGRSESLRTR